MKSNWPSLILALFISVPALAYPRLYSQEIVVLKGAEKLMGPWADWSVADHNVGRACSKLRGLINPETNEMSAVCKVCYTDKYGDGYWPHRLPQLVGGEVLKIKSIATGGNAYVSENYRCKYTAAGDDVKCGGDNFIITAQSSQSNKEVQVMCTSELELDIDEMNEIFKGVLDFTQDE